ASTVVTSILSLTRWAGLQNSSLATTSALPPATRRRSRTRGVLPTSSVTSLAMRTDLLLVDDLRQPLELEPARRVPHVTPVRRGKVRGQEQRSALAARLEQPAARDGRGDRIHARDGAPVGAVHLNRMVDHVARE